MSGITVVIPTIPQRTAMRRTALDSVDNQLLPADAVIVVMDNAGEGACITRTRGLNMVTTEWVAWLDDDDEFYPTHLQALMMHAETTGADMVFPWFDVGGGGSDPFPGNESREFDVENPHQTTITFLVRTEAAKAVGGFTSDLDIDMEDPGVDAQGHRAGEDLRFVIRLARAGYKISHLNQRTWKWLHHSSNTMGLASRAIGKSHNGMTVEKAIAGQVGFANY